MQRERSIAREASLVRLTEEEEGTITCEKEAMNMKQGYARGDKDNDVD